VSAAPLHERLLAEMVAEFPGFAVLPKRGSTLQRVLHVVLVVVTFGGQRAYLTRYHTVMFGKLWVPDSWGLLADPDRYVLLRHERIHLRQRARLGGFVMGFLYLVPFFPLFLAYGRARLEWEAYAETLRATAEVFGVDAASGLRTHIVGRFVGGDYGWMWPFPSHINRWFDEALDEIANCAIGRTGGVIKEASR
jgi:hypothetical protein